MSPGRRKRVLLTGDATDLEKVRPRIEASGADVMVVNEEGLEGPVPDSADVVVFVLSREASYSTQLRIVCGHVFYRVSALEKLLLAVGEEEDAARLAFPEIRHLPATKLAELDRSLRSAPDGAHSNL